MEIEQQFRYDQTLESLYKSFTDISISYPIINSVEISGKFRYIVEGSDNEKRIGCSIKIDSFDKNYIPTYKIKYQQDYDIDNSPINKTIRNKFSFNLPKYKTIKSNFYYESYHLIEDSSLEYDKFRYSFAIDFPISTSVSAEVFYIYKGSIKKNHIDITNIWGSKVEYSF